ncbi:hypothetical protein D3C77_668420 [compost metagenome]
MRIVPVQPHGLSQLLGDLPIRIAVFRRHDLAHTIDAAFGIGERAILFEEGGTRQEDMRVVRRLIQEQVVHDNTFHRGKTG